MGFAPPYEVLRRKWDFRFASYLDKTGRTVHDARGDQRSKTYRTRVSHLEKPATIDFSGPFCSRDTFLARPATRGMMEKVLGLAMTGGGARGAYQAGVLKRIGEIKRVQSTGNPFPIIGGASAGAINGSALAMGAD